RDADEIRVDAVHEPPRVDFTSGGACGNQGHHKALASGARGGSQAAVNWWARGMDWHSLAQYAVFIALVTAVVRPLGGYVERVFSRKPAALDPVLLPVENLIYRLTGVEPVREIPAREYALCFLIFGLAGTLF